MQIRTLKLAYFSPTGTTRSILQAIARGVGHVDIEQIDATRQITREQEIQTSIRDLLIVGVPVYIGRVPALLRQWLLSIQADKTPAVCVVVYGNRAHDDALLELKDILAERGCIPIACAAYVGEHSFSGPEIPIAEGRPDTTDLNNAESFGRDICERLLNISSVGQVSSIDVPGCRPYRGDSKLWSVDFIGISDSCTQCGTCSRGCPVGAIDTENSRLIDIERCITCCSCIKNCPKNARTMKSGLVKDAAIRLNRLCSERKEPVHYFSL